MCKILTVTRFHEQALVLHSVYLSNKRNGLAHEGREVLLGAEGMGLSVDLFDILAR